MSPISLLFMLFQISLASEQIHVKLTRLENKIPSQQTEVHLIDAKRAVLQGQGVHGHLL
jgi:hypothetical protein